MKLKQLEGQLSRCDRFENPKVSLEQYATSPHIAARMIYSAAEILEDGIVCDLGSGCGILSIGSVLAGTNLVYGIEIDQDAISVATSNTHEVLEQTDQIEFINTSVTENVDSFERFFGLFDAVLMNPPFGTKKNAGLDVQFLSLASNLVKSNGHVYSLHKTSTRPFFQKQLRLHKLPFSSGEVLAQVNFDLPKCYKFHKHKSIDVEVDFWHFIL